MIFLLAFLFTTHAQSAVLNLQDLAREIQKQYQHSPIVSEENLGGPLFMKKALYVGLQISPSALKGMIPADALCAKDAQKFLSRMNRRLNVALTYFEGRQIILIGPGKYDIFIPSLALNEDGQLLSVTTSSSPAENCGRW